MIVIADSQVLDDLEVSVRRYVEARRATPTGAAENNSSEWREFAKLGWLGAAVDESHGGFGGPAEMAAIARELGAGLISAPYIEAAVVPTTFLAAASPLAEHADLLAQAIGGDAIITAAFDPDLRSTAITCVNLESGSSVSGRAGPLLGGNFGDLLLIAARDQQEQQTIALVNRAARGVRLESHATIDGGHAAFVTLDQVNVSHGSVWPRDACTTAAFELALDTGIVAQSAQMIGVMARCFELTRSYLLARRQFGQPLGEFQVLRHRLADMYAELEQARALVSAAVAALGTEMPAERARFASAAKVRAIRAARVVGAQSIQLHGAIALTEEYEVGRGYARLLTLEKIGGDLEFHAQRFAAARTAG